VTPKQYLKLMRFQRAVGLIESTEIRDWSDLSLKCGFFDQSHLINDFKTLSGFTPEDYARRRGNYLNYVPVRSVE
ncbi:MAG TPA: AraC family transcriptional regulator, partial [Pyrinomonadaceae bacterium]|nr:AraC family transcriptional regulator [Pyrinomonadaceae bacterium]